MLNFKRETMNGSFNKIIKENKSANGININLKSKDKNIDIKITERSLMIAGGVAVATTAICILGIGKTISKTIRERRKINEEI